jgi:hypothetical protein
LRAKRFITQRMMKWYWLYANAPATGSTRAYELFAIDPTCCFGNPDLTPESSTNVNASFGGRMERGPTTIDLELIGFYRKVSNLIVDTDDGRRSAAPTRKHGGRSGRPLFARSATAASPQRTGGESVRRDVRDWRARCERRRSCVSGEFLTARLAPARQSVSRDTRAPNRSVRSGPTALTRRGCEV